MATLTPKENILRVLHGQVPEYVPSYSYYGPLPGVDEEPPNMGIMLAPLFGERKEDGSFTDLWGVPFTSVAEVGGFSLPTPNTFILEDITKWRDVVKVPERLKDVDWKMVAEEALKNLRYSRDRVSLWYGPGGMGYFMQLMNLMGFTNGLIAMHEEPEEVKALFDYIKTFYMGIARQIIDIIKPDVISMGDDAAAERAPFISPAMYREFLIPIYRDIAYLGVERGLPINMHLCGKGDEFIPDLVKIGVNCWEPVQLENDIDGLQARYGRHLVIGGGWEGRGRLVELDVTDEEIRQSVRDAIDRFAGENKGFIFAAAYTPSKIDDELTAHWNEVLQKEVYDYGRKFYKS